MRAREVVERALQLVKVNASGETMDSADALLALDMLNDMLESWALAPQTILIPRVQSLALTSGLATYTVGPAGDLVTSRPADIMDAAFCRFDGVDNPVRQIPLEEYNLIPVKTSGGWPAVMYAAQGLADWTLTLYPVPSQAGFTLFLADRAAHAEFPDLDTDVPMAPGYKRPLQFCLACEVADVFGRPVPPNVLRIATASKRVLKRQNTIIPQLHVDASINASWPWGYGAWNGY